MVEHGLAEELLFELGFGVEVVERFVIEFYMSRESVVDIELEEPNIE